MLEQQTPTAPTGKANQNKPLPRKLREVDKSRKARLLPGNKHQRMSEQNWIVLE